MRVVAALAILMLVISGVAMADTLTAAWTFTGNEAGTPVDASGTLSAVLYSNDLFIATSGTISDSAEGPTFYGTLIPNPAPQGEVYSPTGFFIYDDWLQPGNNPIVTNGGLLFNAASTTLEINVFSNGPTEPAPNGSDQLYHSDGYNEYGVFALANVVVDASNASAIPEPSMASELIAMLAGLGGLVGVLKRRLS